MFSGQNLVVFVVRLGLRGRYGCSRIQNGFVDAAIIDRTGTLCAAVQWRKGHKHMRRAFLCISALCGCEMRMSDMADTNSVFIFARRSQRAQAREHSLNIITSAFLINALISARVVSYAPNLYARSPRAWAAGRKTIVQPHSGRPLSAQRSTAQHIFDELDERVDDFIIKTRAANNTR